MQRFYICSLSMQYDMSDVNAKTVHVRVTRHRKFLKQGRCVKYLML